MTKTLTRIVLGIAVLLTTILLCHFFFLYSFNESVFYASINWAALLFAAGLGYLLISFIEKKDVYSIGVSALMPWMPIIAIWFVAEIILADYLGYALLALLPILLIASTIGGVFAHKQRIKQNS